MMVYIVCISIVLLFSFGNIWQKQGLVASTRAQNFVARVLSNKCWWLGIFFICHWFHRSAICYGRVEPFTGAKLDGPKSNHYGGIRTILF
jgi:hypothetical protein